MHLTKPRAERKTEITPASREPIVLSVPIPRELVTMVAAPPELVSQRNVLATVGIPPRAYLELLRRPDAPPVTRLGKLRLVEREVLVTWLRAQARRASTRAPSVEADGADAVLAELGLERVGGRR